MTASVSIFDPSPEAAASVLDAITDPQQSLADIAKTHNTTIEAITLWMTSEGVRDRLIASESAHAWRTRLTATTVLPQALSALVRVLDHPNFPGNSADPRATDRGAGGERSVPPSSDPKPETRYPIPALLTHRAIESVRKAATTIAHLTRFRPLPYNAKPRDPAASSSARESPHGSAPAAPTPDELDSILALFSAHTRDNPAHHPSPAAPQDPQQPSAAPAPQKHARPHAPPPPHPTAAAPHPTFPPPSARFARSADPLRSRPNSPAFRLAQAAGAPASPRPP